ncbi:hypothetical protein KA977_05570 [Candidatus Dependentiae bacterium]|nr:hypothetical protein [Candidatus Dependentiae bacterium]
MKKKIFVMFILLILSSSCFALTNSQVDKYLREYEETGYNFLSSTGDTMWNVSLKLPDWPAAWSVLVIFTKSDEMQTISIGTTVASSNKSFTSGLLKYLLQRNDDEGNLGSFSIYTDDKNYVNYYIKINAAYAQLEQVIESVGYIAGYANAIEPEISKFISAE